jgi:hypothetical protein
MNQSDFLHASNLNFEEQLQLQPNVHVHHPELLNDESMINAHVVYWMGLNVSAENAKFHTSTIETTLIFRFSSMRRNRIFGKKLSMHVFSNTNFTFI